MRGLRVLVLLCAAVATTTGPTRADSSSSFIAYLRSERPGLIAFNPSRFDPRLSQPRAHPEGDVRADLAALRPAFDGLVLYAFAADLTPRIVELAAALGYRAVLLGIWDPSSQGEIEGVADVVRRFNSRLALAVCIGNEGINDNRYDIDDLGRARDRLRALFGREQTLLVTTSEPAGDYGWPPLRAFGDFLAPNVHPAIDQETLAPDAAVAWVRERAEAIARVAGKPTLVKETGLPNGGSPAQTPERQRAFWSEWLARGRLTAVDQESAFVSFAAAFEAFDSPWKAAAQQNPMEGRWGLMTADRRPYPAFVAWIQAPGPRR
jgi:exo-beta-1,3-glucanase (GH17 family)